MENRELTIDDYLAMLRRRMKVILIPALLAPVAGFLMSWIFHPKYTSQSLVAVQAPNISDAVVPQVYNEDVNQQMNEILRRVTSTANLHARVESLELVKPGQNIDEVISAIQENLTMVPAPDIPQASTTKRKPGQTSSAAFVVSYTAPSAEEARRICAGLTSMLTEEDMKARQEHTQGTTDFLTKQVADAKQNVDDLDKKIAAFKNQHMGQLPGDEDNNLKILMGLNSQLDANTQNLNRATQDKAYTESLLAQQLATWKSSQSASNPQTLQQQMSQLQTQLIELEARYTPDHPDVIKTKADLDQIRKKLKEINDASNTSTDVASDKGSGSEPPEIRQLRLQIHQYQELLAQATRDQKKLQQEIAVYQSRVSASPALEGEYNQLARDHDNAQKVYQEDLAKQSTSKMATQAEQQQQGEKMTVLNYASLPDSPTFPNRLLFAGGGLGAGLALGLGLALWLEMRDKSIRTQADAESALDLPMLVAVPWLVEPSIENGNGYGNGHFWSRKKAEDPNIATRL